jgi:hypothetical protein
MKKYSYYKPFKFSSTHGNKKLPRRVLLCFVSCIVFLFGFSLEKAGAQGPTIGHAGANATIDCTATPNFTAPTATDGVAVQQQ